MDRLIAANTVSLADADRAPQTGTPGLATDGDPTRAIPPTEWPSYAWNMVSEEERNVIIGAGLVPDGNNWGQLLQAILLLIAADRHANRVHSAVFTANGTWNPPAGHVQAAALLIGGGGGGSNCQGVAGNTTGSSFGGGGGSGGAVLALFDIDGSLPVTVGAGGGSQQNGGTTSLGAKATASGGAGAAFQSALGFANFSAGGVPGTAGLGTNVLGLVLGGGWGSDGQAGQTALFAGNGGASVLGGGGRAGANGGLAASCPGAGGGGAYDPGLTGNLYLGGAGAPGIVWILSWGGP